MRLLIRTDNNVEIRLTPTSRYLPRGEPTEMSKEYYLSVSHSQMDDLYETFNNDMIWIDLLCA